MRAALSLSAATEHIGRGSTPAHSLVTCSGAVHMLPLCCLQNDTPEGLAHRGRKESNAAKCTQPPRNPNSTEMGCLTYLIATIKTNNHQKPLHLCWHDTIGMAVSSRLSRSCICIQSFERTFITLNKNNAANMWLICTLTPMCNPSLKP